MIQLVITPSKVGRHEAAVAMRLFEHGLQHLVLRLPHRPRAEYEAFIDRISPEMRGRILISEYYELLSVYPLGGIYLSAGRKGEVLPMLSMQQMLVTAIHGRAELDILRGMSHLPDLVLLSPVFDSISKTGYRGRYESEDMASILAESEFPMLALGGITPQRYAQCAAMGFAGVALLGNIWQVPNEELAHYLVYPQPKMLSLAGHDPSGGAGVCADARVAESIGVRCITVPSMWTIQNETEFFEASPIREEIIHKNLEVNLRDLSTRVAKIGMMPDLDTIERAINKLCSLGVRRIIWDPLIWVSAGHQQILAPCTLSRLKSLLRRIYLITPNLPECEAWFGGSSPTLLQSIANETGCHILLKGGHSVGEMVEDHLYIPHAEPQSLRLPRLGHDKHGTGCILSTAIAAHLALGHSLLKASTYAQRLVHRAMCSHRGSFPHLNTFHSQNYTDKLRERHRLQYITNTTDPQRLMSLCSAYLMGGGRWIQLRAKEASTEERIALARPLVALCRRYDATLIINDDVEAALRAGADGVHLGKEDTDVLEARRRLGWGKIIGSTCNTIEDIYRAYCVGSDYVGVGPYRHTTTKKRLAPILGGEGLMQLSTASQRLPYPIPMVAIGGIILEDVKGIMGTGVAGIALSGAIEQATDITELTSLLVKLIY